MPYLRGESLQRRLDRQGPLPTEEIVRIAQQSPQDLRRLTGRAWVHRDIKPANILLEDGVERVTLTDFGLARAVDDASMTRSGIIAGTPQYMSPEAGSRRQRRCSQRSVQSRQRDVRHVYRPTSVRAESSYGILRRITDTEPRPIREVNPNIPEWLDRIIQQLLTKSLDDRIQTAEHIATLLQKCLAHLQQPMVVNCRMNAECRPSPNVSANVFRTGSRIGNAHGELSGNWWNLFHQSSLRENSDPERTLTQHHPAR